LKLAFGQMTISELAKDFSIPLLEQVGVDLPAEGETAVRIGIHDASRLEWSVSLPLPSEEDAELGYTIQVEMEIPSNAFARHSPWDQIQSFTRLDGPAEPLRKGDVISIDALRRGALTLANKLSRTSDGFARHCRLASSMMLEAPPSDLEPLLNIWIDAAIKMVEDTRARLSVAAEGDAQELLRERSLVDEYASVRLLEMLAGAERALGAIEGSRHAEALAPVVAKVEAHVADALEREVARRLEKGYISADPTSLEALECYIDRASRLKKHFQEVLFLEPERYEVAQRLHHWVAAFVALIASTWAFVWQIVLLNSRNTGTKIGSSVIFVAAAAGLVYAAKDRIKEMGRTWISGNMHRLYAQRVARFRAPARRLPKRDVIVSARESIGQKTMQIPDTLNPESGATMLATIINYHQRGKVQSKKALFEQGVRRIKHVFRYDLSPLFARIDNATKPVPVLDATTRKVRFTDAPRCYRVPVRVSVQVRGQTVEEVATVVLHKRGLDRLERPPEAHGSDPAILPWRERAKESGLEP
jgi:hypothetical protein